MRLIHTASLLACLTPAVAVAADLGDVRGTVVDADAIGVPGVSLTLRGERLAHERYTTTDDLGRYRLRDLEPGVYELTVEHPSVATQVVRVTIRALRTTETPIALPLGDSDSAIVVTDTTPILDMTTSAVTTALSAETLQDLPVSRDFLSVTETLPGVAATFAQTPSVRGEGSLGNSFRIDGMITRDPGDHSLAQSVPFDAIRELQVYTDGAPAELGPFSGMLVNVVTKSGGDTHRGSLAAYYSQHAPLHTQGQADGVPTQRRFWQPSLSFTAGGPAVPDRLWYFAAFEGEHRTLQPEGSVLAERANRLQGLVKLDWSVNERVRMGYMSTVAPGDASALFTGDLVADDARLDARGLSQSHLLDLAFGLSSRTVVQTQLSYTHRTGRAAPADGDLLTPALVDADGVLYGNARSRIRRSSGRLGGSVVLTRYAEGRTGDHRLRAGLDTWLLTFSENVTHTGQREDVWVDISGTSDPEDLRTVGTEYGPGEGLPCTRLDGSDCAVRLSRHSPGRLRNRVSTFSLFVQDDWAPSDSLHLNLGLRLDVEDGRNNQGLRPRGLDARVMPAPRLGVAYDLFGEGHTKLFANAGRYFDLGGATFWRPSNTASSESVMVEERNDDGEFEWVRTDEPSVSRRYDTGIEHTDRLVAGVSRRIGHEVVVSVRGIAAATRQIPQPTLQPDGSVLVVSDAYKRDYQAMELAVQKVHQDSWTGYGSYTLASSRGNISNEPLVLPLGVTAPYGPLPSDIRHQIRLNAAWTARWGSTFGAIYRFDSGRALTRRTLVAPYGYVGFGNGRGTDRTRAVHQLDLRAAHTVAFGRDTSLEITADVFNVVGSQVPLVVNETDTNAYGTPVVRQEPRSVRLGVRLRW